jgi:serine/threonine protein kinase
MLSGEYEKREKLGEGTYGRVYKVVHRKTGRVACLKELKSVGDGDDGILGASTLREVSALQELYHKNIVKSVCLKEAGGSPIARGRTCAYLRIQPLQH